MAKFLLTAAQVETLWGWETADPWHPCLLAVVTSDNDYAFLNTVATGPVLPVQLNNYAQRNLTVIDMMGMKHSSGIRYPFVAGNLRNGEEWMTLVVDRGGLPKGAVVYLSLDETGSVFPMVNFAGAELSAAGIGGDDALGGRCDSIEFLEAARLRIRLGDCDGILSLAKGSRFEGFVHRGPGRIRVEGGVLMVKEGKQVIRVDSARTTATMTKRPGQLLPMELRVEGMGALGAETLALVKVSQLNRLGQVVGGAGLAMIGG